MDKATQSTSRKKTHTTLRNTIIHNKEEQSKTDIHENIISRTERELNNLTKDVKAEILEYT